MPNDILVSLMRSARLKQKKALLGPGVELALKLVSERRTCRTLMSCWASHYYCCAGQRQRRQVSRPYWTQHHRRTSCRNERPPRTQWCWCHPSSLHWHQRCRIRYCRRLRHCPAPRILLTTIHIYAARELMITMTM